METHCIASQRHQSASRKREFISRIYTSKPIAEDKFCCQWSDNTSIPQVQINTQSETLLPPLPSRALEERWRMLFSCKASLFLMRHSTVQAVTWANQTIAPLVRISDEGGGGGIGPYLWWGGPIGPYASSCYSCSVLQMIPLIAIKSPIDFFPLELSIWLRPVPGQLRHTLHACTQPVTAVTGWERRSCSPSRLRTAARS